MAGGKYGYAPSVVVEQAVEAQVRENFREVRLCQLLADLGLHPQPRDGLPPQFGARYSFPFRRQGGFF